MAIGTLPFLAFFIIAAGNNNYNNNNNSKLALVLLFFSFATINQQGILLKKANVQQMNSTREKEGGRGYLRGGLAQNKFTTCMFAMATNYWRNNRRQRRGAQTYRACSSLNCLIIMI